MEEKKYLGIDWGEVRIGLSLGDSVLGIATPHKVVTSMKELLSVVEDEDIDEIVIGNPLKMKNLDNNYHQSYLNFKKKLEESVDINIEIYDERLSSKAADALLGDKKTKAPRDAIAAMIILQGYLDSQKK